MVIFHSYVSLPKGIHLLEVPKMVWHVWSNIITILWEGSVNRYLIATWNQPKSIDNWINLERSWSHSHHSPKCLTSVSVREATPRAQPTTCVVPCQKPGTWNTLWVPSHLFGAPGRAILVSLFRCCVWTSHVWWLPINCFVKPRLWRKSKPIMITIVSNSNSSSSSM